MTHFGGLISLKDGLVEMYPTPPIRSTMATYPERLPSPEHYFDSTGAVRGSGEEAQRVKGSKCGGSDNKHT